MKTAILILPFMRPDKYKLSLESLSKNKQYDLFVYIDNSGNQDIINQLINITKQYRQDANIIVRQKRYGANMNIICSISQVFNKGYDRLFYVEQDIIFDYTALETLQNAMNWTDKNLDSIGIITSWNYNIKDINLIQKYKKLHGLEKLWYNCTYTENELGYSGQNDWGALFSKKCWDCISPYIFKSFFTLMKDHTYNIENYNELICKLINSKTSIAYQERTISRFSFFGWQAIVDLAMLANNFYKLCLTNPRSKTIGNIGATTNNNYFSEYNLDKIETLNSLNIPKQFILNKQSEKLFLRKL